MEFTILATPPRRVWVPAVGNTVPMPLVMFCHNINYKYFYPGFYE